MPFLYAAHSIKGWPYHVSAGGVVFKEDAGKRFYALLYRGPQWHGEDSWHLPKGTLTKNETLLNCAIRETKEEAGLEGKLWGYLGVISGGEKWPKSEEWPKGGYYEKTTHFFLFEHTKGDGSKMDKEHDRLEWHDPKSAYEKLSFGKTSQINHQQQAIKRAEELLKLIKTPPKYE